MEPLAVVLRVSEHSIPRKRLAIFCPGCEGMHVVPIEGVGAWQWNQSLHSPTLQPSVRVRYGDNQPTDRQCHFFVTEGRMQFLADCTHKLAGQNVDIPPAPEWMQELGQ